jgi:hypothetical protein
MFLAAKSRLFRFVLYYSLESKNALAGNCHFSGFAFMAGELAFFNLFFYAF